MWRLLPIASFCAVSLALSAHAMLDDGSALGEAAKIAGFGPGPSLNLRDTMNFEACAESRISGVCNDITYCGDGEWSLSAALDYREPTVLVEVSCRPGESMLMASSPAAAVVGQALGALVKAGTALAGGGKCMESVGSGTTPDKTNSTMWQFEARAFAVSPLDRWIAASGGGGKLVEAAFNLTCDALMYFGGGDYGSMLTGGGTFPQMGATNGPIPGLPSGITDLLTGMTGETMGEGWETTVTDSAGSVVGDTVGEWDTVIVDGADGADPGLAEEGGGTLEEIGDARDALELITCSPHTFALAKATTTWKYGLLPLFMSDLTAPRTCWTAGNMVDNVTGVPAALAQMSTGGLTEAACAASSMTEISAGAMDTVNEATLGLVGNCVGGWGPKRPAVGYAPNSIRPLSAALIGWRAYDYAVKGASLSKNKGRNLKNTRGQPMFNMDYPFINGSGVELMKMTGLGDMATPFISGSRRHSHKGSGCYRPGDMNPSWYTQGEGFMTNPAEFFASLTADQMKQFTDFASSDKQLPTNNGDYVFTYWKNTRCCIPVRCPRKTYREY